MKTKIVYIVSSNDSDIYLEQAFLSIYSLRKWNPDAFVELVVDQRTDATVVGKRVGILQYINKKTVVDVPNNYNKAQTSRWLKTSLRQHVEGDFLFVDSDTIVTDDLSDIDKFEGEIGAVLNTHTLIGLHPYKEKMKKWAKRDGWSYLDGLKYYNSGVFFVKECKNAMRLFDSWHNRWQKGLNHHHHLYDQTFLAAAVEETNCAIEEMDGIWNCQITKNGLKYLHNAKIVHYLDFNYYCYTKPYAFYDKNMFLEIKEKGDISPQISSIVDNAKCAFPIQNRILGWDSAVRDSAGFELLLRYPSFLRVFNMVSYGIISFPKLLMKKR